MNQRERYVASLVFAGPDKVFFNPGGPRESTLKAWRKQGLPEGVNWYDYLLERLGIEPEPAQPKVSPAVNFRMIPEFEEKLLERKGSHLIVQDWKGNICEISDQYDVTYLRKAKDFVTRRWIKCPVENRDDWEQMKQRYDANAPGRFPEDFEQRCEKLKERDYPCVITLPGVFWMMR